MEMLSDASSTLAISTTTRPWLIIARALLLKGIRAPLNQARVRRVDRVMPKGLRCRDGGWEL